MSSVFIKVPVSERLPKEDGVYIVGYEHGAFSCPYNRQYSFHEEFTDCSIIEWFLEEIELPTEEELNEGNPYPDEDDCATIWAFADGFREGANFILDKFKGGNK